MALASSPSERALPGDGDNDSLGNHCLHRNLTRWGLDDGPTDNKRPVSRMTVTLGGNPRSVRNKDNHVLLFLSPAYALRRQKGPAYKQWNITALCFPSSRVLLPYTLSLRAATKRPTASTSARAVAAPNIGTRLIPDGNKDYVFR